MIFHTQSNSIYEVDVENKRIRRMEGKINPTPRQGIDGEWKKFLDISEIELNSPCVIIWEQIGDISKTTMTSNVMMIHIGLDEN